MDPPFWGTEGYGVPFPVEEYDAIAAAARSMKGKAVISVNDVPEMRRAFKGLPMKRLAIRYQVGGMKRQAARHELLIRSSK